MANKIPAPRALAAVKAGPPAEPIGTRQKAERSKMPIRRLVEPGLKGK
jgi:hypothetical protein